MSRTRVTRVLVMAFAVALFLSAPRPIGAFSVRCDQEGLSGRCILSVPGGMGFEVASENFVELTGGGIESFHLSGDVLLHTPAQVFTLADADLVFEVRADVPLGFEMYGRARAPIGEVPVLGDVVVAGASPIASVGIVARETLEYLLQSGGNELPLAVEDPTRPASYLFFHYDTGLELDLGLADLLGFDTENGGDPFQYSVPGDRAVTIVLDPLDPYLYLSSNARELTREAIDAAREAVARGDDGSRESGRDTDPSQSDESEGRSFELGGVAFSGHGGIAFRPKTTWGLPGGVGEFQGHVWVEADVPLPYMMSVNGELVTYLGTDGVQMGANGDVSVGFEAGEMLAVSLPLGNASAGVRVRESGVGTYFSGRLSPDSSFLPPEVPILPRAELKVAGSIDTEHFEQTRLVAEGDFDLGVAALGDLIGVDLSEAMVVHGELKIDRTGFWLRGTTRSMIHSDVVFSGNALVEAYFSTIDPLASYVHLEGDLSIGGQALGAAARLHLSAQGLFVEGSFVTPISAISLLGRITAAGPQIEGTASVLISTEGMDEAFDRAVADVQHAQKDIENLNAEIERQRSIVRAERERDQQALRDAQAAVAAAQAAVDGIQRDIDINHSLIRKRRSEINWWYRWQAGRPWWEQPGAWFRYLGEAAWRETEIAGRYAAIGTLEASKAVAWATLEAAKATLRGLEELSENFPIDADPRVAGLFVARDAAYVALEVAEQFLANVPRIEVEFFRADIFLSLGVQGFAADVSVATAGVQLVRGWVVLSGDPEVCVELAVVGQICAPF